MWLNGLRAKHSLAMCRCCHFTLSENVVIL
nr:MAG TPA: hypothetical protein [Caudoviricetes sp.]DAU00161.1 MAG TPA: hypothetical protein [Caudoviricetes sp.]DAW60656.1 MAG TPA: hypothetical protein [Caudoviricetes sp.]